MEIEEREDIFSHELLDAMTAFIDDMKNEGVYFNREDVEELLPAFLTLGCMIARVFTDDVEAVIELVAGLWDEIGAPEDLGPVGSA